MGCSPLRNGKCIRFYTDDDLRRNSLWEALWGNYRGVMILLWSSLSILLLAIMVFILKSLSDNGNRKVWENPNYYKVSEKEKRHILGLIDEMRTEDTKGDKNFIERIYDNIKIFIRSIYNRIYRAITNRNHNNIEEVELNNMKPESPYSNPNANRPINEENMYVFDSHYISAISKSFKIVRRSHIKFLPFLQDLSPLFMTLLYMGAYVSLSMCIFLVGYYIIPLYFIRSGIYTEASLFVPGS